MKKTILLLFLVTISSPVSAKQEEPLIKKTVILETGPRTFDINEVEYILDKPLPFMGWRSGICFIIDEYPAPLSGYIAEKTDNNPFVKFSDGSKPEPYSLIYGSITDEKSEEYSLNEERVGVVEVKNVLPNTTEKHFCTYISCLQILDDKDPKTIISINFEAITPFKAKSVYWYTDNSAISFDEHNSCIRTLFHERYKRIDNGEPDFCMNNTNANIAELCRNRRIQSH